MLNPDDESHMWCLHYVFIPIINRHLNNWRAAYVQHSLRTEHNKTPMQLWISGLSEAWGSFRAEDLYLQVELRSFDFGETLVCRHRIAFTQPINWQYSFTDCLALHSHASQYLSSHTKILK
jgi:hypothetical protein